jgi:hypothetical protein
VSPPVDGIHTCAAQFDVADLGEYRLPRKV